MSIQKNNTIFGEEMFLKIRNVLSEQGINFLGVKLVSKDDNYLIYEYNDIFIEIYNLDYFWYFTTNSIKKYISCSNNILKPISETIIDDNVIVVLKNKLPNKDVNADDLINLYCNLRDEGYIWNNPNIQDIYKDEFGHCLLTNYRDIINVSELSYNTCISCLDSHIKCNSKLNKIYEKNKKRKQSKQKIITKFGHVFSAK